MEVLVTAVVHVVSDTHVVLFSSFLTSSFFSFLSFKVRPSLLRLSLLRSHLRVAGRVLLSQDDES